MVVIFINKCIGMNFCIENIENTKTGSKIAPNQNEFYNREGS